MAIIDRVKFDGLKSRDWIIYKYPSEQLVFGTQLIVNEGQVAIFVKGGTICDSFTPGTYTLSTSNIPILHKIINIPFGGDTPFTAEIYYINMTTKLDINWGTTDPIQLIDPKYYVKLRIRAFGQIGLKLKDYRLFFTEVIGGMRQDDIINYEKISSFYKALVITKVKATIADIIINNKISALEVSAQLDGISNLVKEKIGDEFARFGFHVANFFIQSVNFPDEDFNQINKILEDKAAFEIMGDQHYSTKRSFDVYEGAATNENGVAGAFVAGGLGLGAGVAMSSNLNSVVKQPTQQVGSVECNGCHKMTSNTGKFCSFCGTLIEESSVLCGKCGTGNSNNAKYCKECGYDLEEKHCSCGAKIEKNIKFCSQCGKKVE